ncbi:hypothetical protein A3E39_00810 [Candidatus Uhrbacteria bacterium RIFCSPHIGHO2_12_FULL_60_25]|uniref:PDGLE domain-containing protein n=1 Tax=Candidatus Uhrbacteria bacterium RIFCSPHIGHO2_12_FULL_60_25 TaxID=1802399 RepID=A0A1F7UMX8_9BACT|nr:MAG: hypothetical protein A3E39_00810 [Candidatus Uhrbacteria bacterium RIFCSPHIGHO2_12_FULL_60_25]
MRRIVCIFLFLVQATAFSVVPVAAQTAPDTGALGELIKSRMTPPPIGAFERDESVPVAPSATDSEPYVLDRDLTGGIMAAGAALLSAIVIILLVAIVANSKHQGE